VARWRLSDAKKNNTTGMTPTLPADSNCESTFGGLADTTKEVVPQEVS